jgi:hypothetical protein
VLQRIQIRLEIVSQHMFCSESFAVINLRGVSTNKTIIYFIAMQTYKELINTCFVLPENLQSHNKKVINVIKTPEAVPDNNNNISRNKNTYRVREFYA